MKNQSPSITLRGLCISMEADENLLQYPSLGCTMFSFSKTCGTLILFSPRYIFFFVLGNHSWRKSSTDECGGGICKHGGAEMCSRAQGNHENPVTSNNQGSITGILKENQCTYLRVERVGAMTLRTKQCEEKQAEWPDLNRRGFNIHRVCCKTM